MRHRLKLITFFVVPVLFMIAVWFIWRSWPKLPEESLARARQALSDSRRVKAGTYAPSSFERASALYDSAMTELARQGEGWFFARDYSRVDSLAVLCISESLKAKEESLGNQKKFTAGTSHRIEDLQHSFGRIKDLIGWLPLPEEIVRAYSEGLILLERSRISNGNGHPSSINELLNNAESKLVIARNRINAYLESYFESFPYWISLKEEALKRSKQEKVAIFLVDKFGRQGHLIENGTITRSYSIELGSNWIGDKSRKGDKTTPEGRYKVVKRKKGGETRYYKALLLDYPNQEDRERFLKLKSEGIIPENAHIGNLIEIHGGGGRGMDWTDGCIALTNEDMDDLFSRIKTGTPVYVAGSLEPLDKIDLSK